MIDTSKHIHRRAWACIAAALATLPLSGCDGDTQGTGGDTQSTEGTTQGTGSAGGTGGTGGSTQGTGGILHDPCGDQPLTDWERMMLDDHNQWRASVDPPAADMYRVHWDRLIAQNAADWIASCDPEWPHSPESERSNIGGYEILGENLSYCAGSGCADLPEVADGSGLGDGEGWWEERLDYNWQDDSSAGVTSHYTQMVSSNVYAIGCATRECAAPGPGGWDGPWWWTICQYGPRGQAYWIGTKPYEAGAGGLIEVPASIYADHPGLCQSDP